MNCRAETAHLDRSTSKSSTG